MIVRVYLAGPDVFLPNPLVRAAAMKRICDAHGLAAISPLDLAPGEPTGDADPYAIARRNERHIRGCDAILANLTPFRGPSADPGTVYEVGFGRALGRPVFGYATVGANHAERVRRLPGNAGERCRDGLEIEDFGLFENLMVSCGIVEGGGSMLAEDADQPWADLTVFERCVARAADALTRRPRQRRVALAPRAGASAPA